MARQSNSDLLSAYQKKISVCKRWRREEQYDDTWRRLIDLYRGRHYEDISDEDRLLVNISFSTVNVIAPSVAVNYPKIAVNSRRPEDAPKAIITEAVVNYWWKHYKIRPEFRRAVKDFLIVGHGWLKAGYRYVEEESIDQEGDHSDPNADGNEITPSIIVTEDRPFVERVSPFDVFVDPDATSMYDARWIAQRIRRSLKEVKSDKRYSRSARDSINATSWGRYSDDPYKRQIQDTEEGYVEVWEYYDIAKKTMCVFAEGCQQFLVKPMDMPYAFGHPFVMIRNYDIPDYFYPMGDLEAIEPLQRELNATRTQMMNHRKRYSRKYLYKESAFDADGRDALESDYDNVMVPVAGDENLANVVAPFPAVMTPPEFYRQSDIIEGDIQTVSGVSEYQRGGVPEIRRTATEAGIIQDAANARYIFTKLDLLTRLLFREEDDVLLDYVYDDGYKVEPHFFAPIIPTVLVNGCTAGIGTGWSSQIPCYNPLDLIKWIVNWINKEPKEDDLIPWYRGFNGTIEKNVRINHFPS